MILTSNEIEKACEKPKNKEALKKTNEFLERVEKSVRPIIKELGLENLNDLQAFLVGYSVLKNLGQTETTNINAARALVKCGFKGQKKEYPKNSYLIMLEVDDC